MRYGVFSFSLYSEKRNIVKRLAQHDKGKIMKKLLFTNSSNAEINVYADKSASILEWLLISGIKENIFPSAKSREI